MKRRQLIQSGLIASAGAATGMTLSVGAAANPEISGRTLQMSGYPFEHLQPLLSGDVTIEGFGHELVPGRIGDINTNVMSGPQTLDITEIGLIPYLLAWANDDFRDYRLIPVFPLRMFRHRSIFVRADSELSSPAELEGGKIGTPGYSSTSLTWIRGIVEDQFGLSPRDVEWVLSDEDSSGAMSGSISKNEQVVPDGIRVSTGRPGLDESELLLGGEVDALFHAAEPRAFVEGDPGIRRLFEDARAVEKDYFRQTGIYPIMHAVAIKRSLVEAVPELPRLAFDAYVRAKALTIAGMEAKWFLRSLPWFQADLHDTQALMGDDWMPYGMTNDNRKALDALFRYAYEQGLARRHVSVDEVFFDASLTFREPSA